jgi:hypothetical protein
VTPSPTPTPTPGGCTLTQGFWKNHPEEWCIEEVQLGERVYTKDEALQILHQPVQGNGLVALAHQLIAAKLNIECNGSDDSCIHSNITHADALIDDLVVPPIGNGYLDPNVVAQDVMMLDDYNNGRLSCAMHCDDKRDQPFPDNPWQP